jgi:hypothetical protein
MGSMRNMKPARLKHLAGFLGLLLSDFQIFERLRCRVNTCYCLSLVQLLNLILLLASKTVGYKQLKRHLNAGNTSGFRG